MRRLRPDLHAASAAGLAALPEPLRRYASFLPRTERQWAFFRAVARETWLVGPNKMGKCLRAGTLVRMADGSERPIEEVAVGERVMGVRCDGSTAPVRVTLSCFNGWKPVYRFTFGKRRAVAFVDATLEHKALGRNKRATTNTIQPLGTMRDRWAAVRALGWDTGASDDRDAERALLYGLLMGDGCCLDRRIQFTCADPELAAVFTAEAARAGLRVQQNRAAPIQYLAHQMEAPAALKDGTTGRFVAASRFPFFDDLERLGLATKAHEKTIPEAWKGRWNNAALARLVAGLFATDGSVVRLTPSAARPTRAVQLNYTSTSRRLVETLRWILEQRFGVYGSTIISQQREGKRAEHALTILNYGSLVRFAQAIALPGRKGRLLRDGLRSWAGKRSDGARIGFRSVEPIGVEPTYDICVDNETHLFVLANGLVVSNTTIGTICCLGCATGVWPASLASLGARWRIPSSHPGNQPGRILILASTYKQMVGACLREFRRWCPPEWIYKFRARDEIHTLKRFDERGIWYDEPGIEFWWRTVEQGREKFQGNEFDLAWIDEEPKDRPLSELAVMLGPRNGKIIGTLTPVFSAEQGGATWLVDDLLNPARNGELDPAETIVVFGERGDQVNADGSLYSKAKLEWQEAQYEEWEAAVRVRGEFIPAGGHSVFDADHLALMASFVTPPILKGDVLRGGFVGRHDGPLAVWKEPQKGHQYVIPADCSGGDAGSTFAVAHVIDRETGEQVARYRARIDATQYAFVLRDLGMIYQRALLGPEANPGGSGNVVIDRLLELRYPRLLRRPDPPGVVRRTGNVFGGTHADKFGFYTSFEAREEIITLLREALRPRADGRPALIIHDEVTVGEFRSFQRNAKGRAVAAKGRFDDCVLSAGIGVWLLHNTPGAFPGRAELKAPAGWNPIDRLAQKMEDLASSKRTSLTTTRFDG